MARTAELTSWYEALGVRVSPERLRAVLNLTCWIPFAILRQGLHELVVGKVDGYQTAPQPGEIFAICRRIASRDGSLEWNVQTGAWAEPAWSQASRRLLATDSPRRRLAGSSDGLEHLGVATRQALEEVGAEYLAEQKLPVFSEVVDGPTQRRVLGDPTASSWEAMKGEPA